MHRAGGMPQPDGSLVARSGAAAHRAGELAALVSALRAAQGFALNVGAIVIEVATATDDADRTSLAELLLTFRAQFVNVIKLPMTSALLAELSPKVGHHRSALDQVVKAFDTLPETAQTARITADEAAMITRIVRVSGVPAILELMALIRTDQKAAAAERDALAQDRLTALDTMFTEVEQIGRMIHLISLNASVEAARAGGESGRSFKVIADEIRSLAAKSATVIDTTRDAMSDDYSGGIRLGVRC